ncbi:MAG: TM1812 family CRISPR-associated protein [Thermoplasmata archaeon]
MGGKNLIIQIYGRNDYQNVKYYFENKIFEKRLISEVICEYLGDGDLYFLVPESLLLIDNPAAQGIDNETLLRLINDKQGFIEYFNKKIESQLVNKNLINKVKIIRMQSVGEFKSQGGSIQLKFNNNLDNISIYLYKDLFSAIPEYDKIFVDLSTGLNFYSTVIVDAIKNIIVYLKIKNYLKTSKEFYLTFSTPIVNNSSVILRYPLNAKTFFEFPKNVQFKNILKFSEIEDNSNKQKLGKEISNNFRDEIKNLEDIFYHTKIGFNAIRFNTPLVFYTSILNIIKNNNEMDIINHIFEILNFIENKKEIKNFGSIIEINRYKLDSVYMMNIFIIISIFSLIKKIIEGSGENTLNNIQKYFTKIYDDLNIPINKIFLNKEIESIKSLNRISNNWRKLVDIKSTFNNQNILKNRILKNIKGSYENRNFLAHSGLEENITYIKKDGENIYLKYNDSDLEKIKNWLKSL